jgi:hypothetical protein
MSRMLVYFWAARWLAVLSMQEENLRSLANCPLPCSASPADALLQVGGYSELIRACIRTDFAPDYPAFGYVKDFLYTSFLDSRTMQSRCENLGMRPRTRVKHFELSEPEGRVFEMYRGRPSMP